MDGQETSGSVEGFRVEDPCAAFSAHSREEAARRAEVDAGFDQGLHEEAVALVLSRLKGGSGEGAS